MNKEALLDAIATGQLKDLDLSSLSLNEVDFKGCRIENVVFSTSKTKTCHSNLNFKGCELVNVKFDHATLEDCNFDSLKSDDDWEKRTLISRTSFKNSVVKGGRFRGAQIMWSDFRYSELINGTYEEAEIVFCDFYRAFFLGVVIFRKSVVDNCSLFYTHFDESAGIRKENLKMGKIIQENKRNYRMFLEDWATLGTGVRVNNLDEKSAWKIEKSIRNRFADAEEIYKALNGFWQSKGLLGDSNWAYVKGKRMERKNLWKVLCHSKLSWKSPLILLKILWNLFKDASFGYGESMRKMILTYAVVVLIFAYIFYAYPQVEIFDYIFALKVSFKNMVAISSDQLQNVSPFIDMLNVIQTTIGILLTGIFGFILGNKIRNQ